MISLRERISRFSELAKEFWGYNRERIGTSFTFFTRVWQSFSAESVGRIPVDNSSGGLLKPLIEPFFPSSLPAVRVLLVSEPPVVAKQVLEYLESMTQPDGTQSLARQKIQVQTLEERIGLVWSPQVPQYDLCSKNFVRDLIQLKLGRESLVSELVVCQSLLEHVLDPVQVMDNLIELLSEEGVLALQTCNPIMRIHRFPIDTLRFHPDFFFEYAKKKGLNVVVKESGASIFCFLGRGLNPNIVRRINASFSL
jgi:hypothetical protein